MPDKIIGLIAGNGKFPIAFAQKAKTKNYKVIAAGIVGDTSAVLRFFVDKLEYFRVGQLQSLFSYFKKEGVSEVIMAGQVNPENLFDKAVVLDDKFKELFVALKDRKADTIFKAVADQLKTEGLKLIDSTFLIRDMLAPKGTLTRRAPTLGELSDIEFGCKIAKLMGGIDVGQTVVVKQKAIVAIEAMEGTDQAILRGGKIAQNGAVVIKMSKPDQDMRFDVPVVGLQTIKNLIKVKAACLAIEAGKTIFIDKEKAIALANSRRICILAV